MKALLLKDWYVAARYCRIHLGFVIGFSILSLFIDTGLLYLMYPILFAGMIPVYILSIDEKMGWTRYVQTLPYDRSTIVGEKYVVALISLLSALLLMIILWCVRIALLGGSIGSLLRTLGMISCVGLLFPALTLPFMLRFGVEKGRFVTMGVAALLAMGVVGYTIVTADPDSDPAAKAVASAGA